MRRVVACVCMIGISFGSACGMLLSKDTQDHPDARWNLCMPVFDSGILKTFLSTNKKLDLKRSVDNPVKAVNETDRAVTLADAVALPKPLVFLPEASVDSSFMTKWGTVPFDLQGKGLRPPVVYKKKIGERVLQKLGDEVSIFDKGVACYFAGDLFKTGKESLFSRYVMPGLDKGPKVVEKYWEDLHKALIKEDSYKEIRENIVIELKKRGIRIQEDKCKRQ